MIYNINGIELNNAYDVDGSSLTEAFNINGEQVFPYVLKVMTYNVRWFTDFNGQKAMQKSIIDTNAAHIIGVQEISQNGTINATGTEVLAPYTYKQLSNHKNYMALMSKIQITDYSTADFTHQDPYDASQYNETRAYQKCTLNIGGKSIKWYNAHLCFHDATIKAQQMMEIKSMTDLDEYCIITGDFNSYALSTSDTDYVSMFKPYIDDGYNLANCTAEQGFTKTWTDSATATSTAQMSQATDNIITSANIDIISVKFDPTKFSYLNGQAIDHIPVIVQLKIN